MAQIAVAQVLKTASAQTSRTVVPVGPGGLPGHILRMVVMVFTGGFIYPNTFVEGMDLTAIQKAHELPAQKSDKNS
jgi:hypothetical protein